MPSGKQLRQVKESAAAVEVLEDIDTEVLADAAALAGDLSDLTDRVDAVAAVAALTDNSGGTANGTVAVIPDPADTPADVDALRDDLVATVLPPLRDAIADLTAKVNALIDAAAIPA